MKFILIFLVLVFFNSCSSISEKEEIHKLFKELTDMELPDDFKIIRNELHGDYQSNDSDFSRDIILKFSEKSFEELSDAIKNSGKYSCDTIGRDSLEGDLPRVINRTKTWEFEEKGLEFKMSKSSFGLVAIHLNYQLREMWIELYE